MTKRVTHELRYDAPAAEVFAMLITPEFREEVCERMRVISATATVTPRGEGADVVIEQVQPAQGLPSFATKFVGDTIEIIQREHWTSPAEADIEVVIPGKPGEMTGTARLTESGGTTVELVELDIKVRIPLVGGRIESLVADMLQRALETENATGRDYLSR